MIAHNSRRALIVLMLARMLHKITVLFLIQTDFLTFGYTLGTLPTVVRDGEMPSSQEKLC